MLACRDVTRLVASDALSTAGWRTRLAVRIHQAMCRHCRRYARQLRAIGDAARAAAARADRWPEEAEERMLARILREEG
ncbi:MAG: hypothetical protein AB7N73_08430 [Gemmatimonadales bacterium]